jgi:hypothetical protein
VLDSFAIQQGGSQYRRVIGAFQRIFGATIFFGADSQRERAAVVRPSYRCFSARGRERVPLFGDFGLISQLGSADYARHRKFREKLEGWLDLVRTMWPQDGAGLLVDRANAILPDGGNDARN